MRRDGRAHLILCRELLWRQVAEAGMGAFAIVLDAPLFDLVAGVVEQDKDMLVEPFLA